MSEPVPMIVTMFRGIASEMRTHAKRLRDRVNAGTVPNERNDTYEARAAQDEEWARILEDRALAAIDLGEPAPDGAQAAARDKTRPPKGTGGPPESALHYQLRHIAENPLYTIRDAREAAAKCRALLDESEPAPPTDGPTEGLFMTGTAESWHRAFMEKCGENRGLRDRVRVLETVGRQVAREVAGAADVIAAAYGEDAADHLRGIVDAINVELSTTQEPPADEREDIVDALPGMFTHDSDDALEPEGGAEP